MTKAWKYIIILMLASCAKEADWQMEGSADDHIVIDAIITNESGQQGIYIHYNKTDMNEVARAVSGAVVIVNNEDSTWQFIEDANEKGKYSSQGNIVAVTGKNYALLVLHQDHVYSAQAYMVEGKAFSELSYQKNLHDELYHIDYVASAFEQSDPAMWEILIDWSDVSGYENADPGQCKKRLLFYTLNTLDVSQVFAPLLEEVSFPAGSRIDQRRYSLSPEHAAFIRSLLLETSWQGGVFPSEPANILSNISEGGLGFFGICAVNSLSISVEP